MDPLDAFRAAAEPLAEAVRSMQRGSRWALHCDTDADGLASAAIAATALRRVGQRFHIHASRDKTLAAYEAVFDVDADGHMVLDKGTSHLDALADGARRTSSRVLVLDHHNLVGEAPDGIHLLNPRAVSLDGSRDACSSTTTAAFALALLGDSAWDLAPVALVGAIGDWQHMGGWQGWNKHLVDGAIASGHLRRVRQPAYIGVDLVDAMARWPRPAIPGITGDAAGAERFLDALGIPAAGDVEALGRSETTRLVSGLVLQGLAHGVAPKELDRITHETLWSDRLGTGLRHAFRIVDACGREGRTDVGISYLFGDPAARREADSLFTSYRAKIEAGLTLLRDPGPSVHRAMQHLEVEDPGYTGMVGGIGITHVAADKSRPLVVTAVRPDGDVQVSTRGSEDQVARGLDLGSACLEAGKAVGREGGGHPVAAGIVVAPGELERFLGALDDALVKQAFMEDA